MSPLSIISFLQLTFVIIRVIISLFYCVIKWLLMELQDRKGIILEMNNIIHGVHKMLCQNINELLDKSPFM